MEKLESKTIEEQLKKVSDWNLNGSKIHRSLIFKDFNECMFYINKIANIANELNHHPEWFNVYNKLDITLTSHDINGLSNLDFIFAEKVNSLISNISK